MANAPTQLARTRLFAGVWEGVLKCEGADRPPEIEVTHLGDVITHKIQPLKDSPGHWALRIPVPPERLSDGVQVFLITEKPDGRKLGSFTLVTGEPLEEDIRAELELLRAELDMLKKAFRSYSREHG